MEYNLSDWCNRVLSLENKDEQMQNKWYSYAEKLLAFKYCSFCKEISHFQARFHSKFLDFLLIMYDFLLSSWVEDEDRNIDAFRTFITI